jgi:hypothetical protein
MEEIKTTTYKHTQRYGMEGIGDMEHEYLTPEQVQANLDRTSAYIEDCKLKGIYGKEYTTSITVNHDPLFDDNKVGTVSDSFRMEIINIGDLKRKLK